jgi:hypothetical protein
MLRLDVSVLQQPVLPPEVSVLQQPVLPLDVSVLLPPVLLLENLEMSVYSSLCCLWMYLFYKRLCCARRCLAYSSLCYTHGLVCLQEPRLCLCRTCATVCVPVYQNFCDAPGRVSTIACAAPVRVHAL